MKEMEEKQDMMSQEASMNEVTAENEGGVPAGAGLAPWWGKRLGAEAVSLSTQESE